MSKEQYGTRDAKIIRENEGKTPYELLQLGLSKAAYERMVKGETTVKEAVSEPKEPVAPKLETPATSTVLKPDVVEQVTTKKQPAQPRLGRTAEQIGVALIGKARQVTVIGPTGIPKLMADKQAERLVQGNPNLYKIVKNGK